MVNTSKRDYEYSWILSLSLFSNDDYYGSEREILHYRPRDRRTLFILTFAVKATPPDADE